MTAGFAEHSAQANAPDFSKQRLSWVINDAQSQLQAALTADLLWDWLYIDELWVNPNLRGQGLGQQLMAAAEDFAKTEQLQGVWLWTQSWQAEGFYNALGYEEFARFENFPRGHRRIGFRKTLTD
ncbi:MAG: GNAT family N-acetyltransferase [Pseudomonadota bacterium]